MTQIKRCWRPQGRFLREFARTGSVSAARRTVYNWREADADFYASWERAVVGADVPAWRDGRIVGHETVVDTRVLWKLLQTVQAETYGPRAAELRAKRERDAELSYRRDEAEKRVAAYEAGLLATIARKRPDTDPDTDDAK